MAIFVGLIQQQGQGARAQVEDGRGGSNGSHFGVVVLALAHRNVCYMYQP